MSMTVFSSADSSQTPRDTSVFQREPQARFSVEQSPPNLTILATAGLESLGQIGSFLKNDAPINDETQHITVDIGGVITQDTAQIIPILAALYKIKQNNDSSLHITVKGITPSLIGSSALQSFRRFMALEAGDENFKPANPIHDQSLLSCTQQRLPKADKLNLEISTTGSSLYIKFLSHEINDTDLTSLQCAMKDRSSHLIFDFSECTQFSRMTPLQLQALFVKQPPLTDVTFKVRRGSEMGKGLERLARQPAFKKFIGSIQFCE